MDGLSGAASAIAVVSLAVQLAESVCKLRNFILSIQSAHQEVEDIIDDVYVLGGILEQIRQSEETFGPNDVTTAALLRCKRQLRALEIMVQKWSREMNPASAKKISLKKNQLAVRVALSKDRVKALKGRVGEAKTTLVLAMESANSRFQQMQFHRFMQEFARLSNQHCQQNFQNPPPYSEVQQCLPVPTVDSRSVHQSNLVPAVLVGKDLRQSKKSVARYASSWDNWNSWSEQIFGWFSYQHGEAEVTKPLFTQKESKTAFSFTPPWWLQELGFRMTVQARIERTCHSGWNISLKTPTVIPMESPIWKAVRNDDVEYIRDTIQRGEISLNDIDPNGSTLLHVAAYYYKPRLCTFLLESGADHRAQDFFGCTAFLVTFYRLIEKGINLLELIKTIQALMRGGEDFLDMDAAYSACLLSELADVRGRGDFASPDDCPPHWLLKQMLPSIRIDRNCYNSLWWAMQGIRSGSGSPLPVDAAYTEVMFIYSDHIAKNLWLMFAQQAPEEWDRSFIARLEKHFERQPEELHFFYTGQNDEQFWKFGLDEILGRLKPTAFLCMVQSPLWFDRYRQFLDRVNVSKQDFVCREACLVNKGAAKPWSEKALLKLLDWDFTGFVDRLCPEDDGLMASGPRGGGKRQHYEDLWLNNPLWELAVERIRLGEDPDAPFGGRQKEAFEEWRRCWVQFKEGKKNCVRCQLERCKRHGCLKSELESSPFLLDI